MKPTSISAEALFEAQRETLHWQWIAGHSHPERRFDDAAVRDARSSADLVGYLNYIHPYRVQILGVREIAYLTNATAEDCARRISRIVTLEPPVLVLTDNQVAPDALLSMCERAQIPMFSTHEPSAFVIDVLRAYLTKHFAERTSKVDPVLLSATSNRTGNPSSPSIRRPPSVRAATSRTSTSGATRPTISSSRRR